MSVNPDVTPSRHHMIVMGNDFPAQHYWNHKLNKSDSDSFETRSVIGSMEILKKQIIDIKRVYIYEDNALLFFLVGELVRL